MAQREKGGRVVFIGNIPYGVSEEQIMDIFGRAGQVVNFRLVYDKETGQPKGFGFLEYTDTDAAASAVRNLNEFDLNGRTLRVDYSNDNRSAGASNNQTQPADSNRAPPPAHFNVNGQPPPRPDPHALPPLPPGAELPAGVTAFDAISQTISAIPTPQLIDFISQVKGLCASNPGQATALLNQAPQLAYAVFQAMLLLDLVDTNVVSQLVVNAPQAVQPPPPAQPPQPQLPPVIPPHAIPPQGYPPQALPPQGYTPQGQPPMPPMPQGYPPGYGPAGYAPTPPQQPYFQPPAQQPPPAQQAPPAQAPSQEQSAMIAQLMAMTRDQILSLAEPIKSQVIALRSQYGNPV